MAADSEWLGTFGAGPAARRERTAQAGTEFHRFPAISAGVVAMCVLVLCVPFRSALQWLWATWTALPEFSHGPILPIVAAFLVWQRRDRLARLPFEGSAWGVVVLLAGCALFVLGDFGSVVTLQQYAFVVALAGVALALTGTRAFRELLVPLIVLVLMVPQPTFVLANLSAQLQLLSSSIGVAVIRAAGISVFQDGNVIDLGGYRLQVVEACDGLRYLFPLLTIALLIAYFYRGATWKRIVIFALGIPITVLMNSARVGMIGVMVEHWGIGMAEGFLHEFQGWAVFMLSTALLVGAVVVLNAIGGERVPWRQRFGMEFPAPIPAGATVRDRRLPPSFLAACAIAAALALAAALLPPRVDLVPQRDGFDSFPTALDGWQGRRTTLDGAVADVLAHDDYVQIDYVRNGGPPVNLYVSWYASQRERRVVHSPRACIPGGGWQILEIAPVMLRGSGIRANRMVVGYGDSRQVVYYWFDQRGRKLTNEYLVKWFLFWDGITQRRSDGALVRFVTPVVRGEPAAAADERLQDLVSRAVPLLPRYVPQ